MSRVSPSDLHLTGRQAGRHADRAGAEHLVLTHLDADNDPALSLAEVLGIFAGPASLAAPRLVIDLDATPPEISLSADKYTQ